MKLTHIAVTTLGLLALVGALPSTAQEAASAGFGEQVNVSEVLLDVLVTDKQGNVIIGLTPEDFVVEEDGKVVEVSDLSFYSNRRLLDAPSTLGEQAAMVDTQPQSRYFILFFEEQQRANSDLPELNLLKRQLEAARESRNWVKKEKLLDDYVAVVSYDVKLKIHQDFTQNGNEILSAIDRAAAGNDPGANWPSRMPAAGTISLRSNLPPGNELRDKTTRIYDALQLLAHATDGIVGRKNLIFFGTGVELGQPAAFGLAKPDPRFWPATLQALNDHNVAVYPIDLAPTEVDYAQQSSMHQLADETGGRYYWNFANFLAPLKQVGKENSGYYLLSYRATHPAGTSGYQKVKVRLKNPEFKIKSRAGYLFGEEAASS